MFFTIFLSSAGRRRPLLEGSLWDEIAPVLLHRDPVVLCASVCSLITTLSGTFTDADHTAYVADHWTAMLEESVKWIDAFRSANPQYQIVDVQYADLVRDPLRTVEDLYGACGTELDGSARDAIAAYLNAHPRGKFGVHGYDLAEFGLDAGELAALRGIH